MPRDKEREKDVHTEAQVQRDKARDKGREKDIHTEAQVQRDKARDKQGETKKDIITNQRQT